MTQPARLRHRRAMFTGKSGNSRVDLHGWNPLAHAVLIHQRSEAFGVVLVVAGRGGECGRED